MKTSWMKGCFSTPMKPALVIDGSITASAGTGTASVGCSGWSRYSVLVTRRSPSRYASVLAAKLAIIILVAASEALASCEVCPGRPR